MTPHSAHQLSLTPISKETIRPIVIAGPCSAETRKQLLQTGLELQSTGITMMRAGVWKPRTYPDTFEGVGEEALAWLRELRDLTGMQMGTEVGNAHHVELALRYGLDMLWIGARTTANPFVLDEIADALAGTDIPVWVKNPLVPDIDIWIGALQRLNLKGITRLGAIHRGFSSPNHPRYRNAPMWQIPMRLKSLYPELPMLCDPSHIGGRRDLIAPLCQDALDRCFDGLFIESHIHPDEAWSDAPQQVTPQALLEILHQLVVPDTCEIHDHDIDQLRLQIDDIDEQIIRLIADRAEMARRIGLWKSEHSTAPLQLERFEALINSRSAKADEYGLPKPLIKNIFEQLHESSVEIQCNIHYMDRDDEEGR